MMRALMISATGMAAQQLAMDTISNNLANVNTTGFKASQAKFSDVFYQQVAEADAAGGAAPSLPVGLGVQNSQIQKIFTAGQFENTGNAMDFAIQGEGFFQVTRPDGTVAYTRDGALKINGEGVLVTSLGDVLAPEIQIPRDATEVSIGSNGVVTVARQGQNAPQAVGQLELAKFVNPGGLENLGQNLFQATPASGEALVNTPGQEGMGTLVQGVLERSNVNLVQEMVNMIFTQRAYEVNTKAIQSTDEMMKMANNLRRV